MLGSQINDRRGISLHKNDVIANFHRLRGTAILINRFGDWLWGSNFLYIELTIETLEILYNWRAQDHIFIDVSNAINVSHPQHCNSNN